MQELIEELLAIKETTAKLAQRKADLESSIIDAMKANTPLPTEGTRTDSVGSYKVSVACKLNRKVDFERWVEISGDVADEDSPMRYKAELDTKKARELEKYKPEVWALISRCVTTSPAKPTITIKEAK